MLVNSKYDGEQEHDVLRSTFLNDPSGCCKESVGVQKKQGEQQGSHCIIQGEAVVAGPKLRAEGWEGGGWQRCKFQIEDMQASLMGWLGG